MAVDAAAPRQASAAWTLPLARVVAIPARFALAGIVSISVAIRLIAALAHATPLYFPDEYIYTAISRGIADSGRPLLRGVPAHFPALLEPLLASPFQHFAGPELAYRLTQGLNAFAMSLAAIPVYLLARKLGLGKGFALGSALLAVVCPDLFYVSFVLGEPIAYPLVLAAVYAGVCALATPSRRNQFAFLAFAALATLARVQFVILPLAFVIASLTLERGRLRRVVRTQRFLLGLLAVPIILALAAGPSKVLGYYSAVGHLHLHASLLQWTAIDLMLLAYACGWVLVPGALVGIGVGLVRPRSREEGAFAGLYAALGAGLFAEAVLYATNSSWEGGRFQERYLAVLLPLAAPAFGLYLKRRKPRKAAIAIIAFGLLAVSARIPLSGYTSTTGRQDSPFLLGVFRLEEAVGTSSGALTVAVVVAILSVAAFVLASRRRAGAAVLALSIVFLGTVAVGAFLLDHRHSTQARATYLPADARWVDHARLGPVTLVQTAGTPRELGLEQLFWNRSVNSVALMKNANVIDAFSEPGVTVAGNGELIVRGHTLRSALLVPHYAVIARFAGATEVASTILFDLWRPTGTPRLELFAGGHYYDNWLAPSSYVRLWPQTGARLHGTLRFTLFRPAFAPPAPMHIWAPGFDRHVVLARGEKRALVVPVSGSGPWTLELKTSGGAYLGDGRPISVRSSPPVFVPAAGQQQQMIRATAGCSASRSIA